jgi:hypothetical protein
MMTTYYASAKLNEDNNVIVFESPQDSLSEEALVLKRTIMTAAARIRNTILEADRRSKLLKDLTAIAVDGLAGNDPQPREALDQLEGFKIDVLNAAKHVRDDYIRSLYIYGLAWIVTGGAVIIVWGLVFSRLGSLTPIGWTEDAIPYIGRLAAGFACCLIGIGIGVIAVESIRNRDIGFDNFDVIYRYGFSPLRHLLFVTTIGLVFLILLVFNVFQIGVGGLLLNEVSTNPPLGIIVGLVCSISEPSVSRIISTLEPIVSDTSGNSAANPESGVARFEPKMARGPNRFPIL